MLLRDASYATRQPLSLLMPTPWARDAPGTRRHIVTTEIRRYTLHTDDATRHTRFDARAAPPLDELCCHATLIRCARYVAAMSASATLQQRALYSAIMLAAVALRARARC